MFKVNILKEYDMGACAKQSFSNVSPDAWTCLRKSAAAQGYLIDSDAGEKSDKGFTFSWHYDPASLLFEITCTESPWWAPCSTINGKIHELIDASGCLARAAQLQSLNQADLPTELPRCSHVKQVSHLVRYNGKSLFDAWDYVGTINVSGSHAHAGGETCETHTFNASSGKFVAWDQQLIKKDNDTHWEFQHISDTSIAWHVCANNCVFSCDEITLQVMYRVGPA